MQSNLIDLPSAPSFLHGEGESLHNSLVSIALTDGKHVRGVLRAVDSTGESMRIIDQTTGVDRAVAFAAVRCVNFERDLVFRPGINPALHDTAPSGTSPQEFSVTFVTGQPVTGRAYTAVADGLGLHAFMAAEGTHAHRIFIPLAAFKDYQLGPRLGEMLQREHGVDPKAVALGLKAQQDIRSKPLGQYLTEQGIVNEADLRRALAEQGAMPNLKLGDILLEAGLIRQEQLDAALELQRTDRSRRLGDLLVHMGAVTEDLLYQALARKLGVPFVRLRNFDFDPMALALVPAGIAQREIAMPLLLREGYLVVAVADPTRSDVTKVLGFVSNRKVEIAVATASDIHWAIEKWYGETYETPDDPDKSTPAQVKNQELTQEADLKRLAEEKPIVRLVQSLFMEGFRRNASDIHIRPVSKGVQILFRIHGAMTQFRNFGKSLLPVIVSRIKVIGGMDIAQRRLPQDGRVRISVDGQSRDMRISMVPTVHGESVVIRLLSSAGQLKPLHEIGFSTGDTERFREMLHRGAGMILVTGPTGSGKSSTLYSALAELRGANLHIVSIEDPVEITMDGIEQIQAHHDIGLTFENALRNILRHDPDVVMIGEIRDKETAAIAFKGAQTGHLVLSTLHTNGAAATVMRLRDMGIEPHIISSSLLGVIAQRLVRKNCPHCRVPDEVSKMLRASIGAGPDERFFTSTGCDKCLETGISGRFPAYELLVLTSDMRDRIGSTSTTTELHELAVAAGMRSMMDCALEAARTGDISAQEVHRLHSM